MRAGGWKLPSDAADVETLRGLGEECGGFGGLEAAPASIDCARTFEVAEVAVPLRGVSPLEVEDAQCCERIERLSSIGVNMLLVFADILLTGSTLCSGDGCGGRCSSS